MTPPRGLPENFARCDDACCPCREECLRWVYREHGDYKPGSAITFRESDGKCHYKMERGKR